MGSYQGGLVPIIIMGALIGIIFVAVYGSVITADYIRQNRDPDYKSRALAPELGLAFVPFVALLVLIHFVGGKYEVMNILSKFGLMIYPASLIGIILVYSFSLFTVRIVCRGLVKKFPNLHNRNSSN